MSTSRTTPLREHMRTELQLAGLSDRTQEPYLRTVRQLAEHFGRPPDQLTEAPSVTTVSSPWTTARSPSPTGRAAPAAGVEGP
jgi:hypothetical protein